MHKLDDVRSDMQGASPSATAEYASAVALFVEYANSDLPREVVECVYRVVEYDLDVCTQTYEDMVETLAWAFEHGERIVLSRARLSISIALRKLRT